MGRAVVGDFDLEDHGVAFGRSAVATGKCLDGDQIGFVIHNNGFVQVIANGVWIRLVARCRAGNVGESVSALANIHCALECQRCRVTRVQNSDGVDSGGRVIGTLCDGTGNKRQTGRQRVGQ